MPNKPRLPTNARRLPKGTTRDDYEPEVIAEYDRNRWRRHKRTHRLRKAHEGRKDVAFLLDTPSRTKLAALAEAAGTTQTAVIERLIKEAPCPSTSRTP